MLPLPKGSRLVVDASERTVRLGLTCPAELLKLHKRGVEIFSVMNLHAKVYVVGRNVFVGSANVSRHSADTLVEAMIQTTDSEAVTQARQFVTGLCLQLQRPEQLKALRVIYRPPHRPSKPKTKSAKSGQAVTPEIADLRLAQVSTSAKLPHDEERVRSEGEATAARMRLHRSSTHSLDNFRWWGSCGFERGQQIVRVEEDRGFYWVYPPEFVLHVEKVPRKSVWYVHVEGPKRRRKSLNHLVAQLGRGAKNKLSVSGPVKDGVFAQALLRAWNA
ncbi:phospholipase D-like domain-containing protein [Prosthecobacter sp.]|uniref:phospholipase D-like domain-containing protein n=1 Tax=Prosthecobacter sp. TaxID=1965333 RepID=UPI0037841017